MTNTPPSREFYRPRIGKAADAGLLIACRCDLCRRTRIYLAHRARMSLCRAHRIWPRPSYASISTGTSGLDVEAPARGGRRHSWPGHTEPKEGEGASARPHELVARQEKAWGPRKGQPVLSSKRPMRHVARFLLIGVYTGSRAAAICGAAFEPTPGHGWIDLKSGLFYRKDQNQIETTKRQPTVLVPRRLLMHLRRWKRKNPKQKFVVEFNGKPIAQVNKAFARLAQLAGLGPDVIPHSLRHTCATWLSQRGATMAEAAGFLGMSEAIYDSVYRKFSPTNRIAGFQAVPIFEIFGTPYHPSETILDDGWVEGDREEAA